MGVAVKRLRIGRRGRSPVASSQTSPRDRALAPALHEGRWQVPERFNFTRDVLEALADSSKRQALRCIRRDGIIEPRTFSALASGSSRWARFLREHEVGPGDTVTVLLGGSAAFADVVLGCLKIGAVAVPVSPEITPAALEARLATTGSAVVVANPSSADDIAQLSFSPEVHYLEEESHVPKRGSQIDEEPTEDTAAQDVALLFWTSGTETSPKPVAHTHASTFATRLQAGHWLGAGAGDVVWCVAESGSALTAWHTLFGPWACGAEVVLQESDLDPRDHLELAYRLGTTIFCQTPADYRTLAGIRDLDRFRPLGLRRLVSTGDVLDPDLVRVFEEAWGTTILDGYGQTETNVIVARDELSPEGSLGRPLPGHYVEVIDEQGNELPPGIEGDLALRGKPPTLFTGYWESPEETKSAFRGDWYVTGDCARMDEEGTLWFVGRSEDVITGRGGPIGPAVIERVLREHAAVAASAVIGVRDLERGGQFVRAFVELEPKVEGTAQLQAELRHFVGESLPEQHVPREIEFVDELPTSRSGAVSRSALRARPVEGRPLWESAPAEPEPDAATALVLPPTLAPEPQAPVEPTLEPVGLAEPPSPVETAAAFVPAFDEPVFPASHPEAEMQVVEPPYPIEPDPEPVFFTSVVSEIPEAPVSGIDAPVEPWPAEVVPEPEPEPEPPKPESEPELSAAVGLPPVIEEVVEEPLPAWPEVVEPAVEPELEPVAEAAPLEAPAEEAPRSTEPDPAPEPLAFESLPDFIVDPSLTPERAAPPPPEPEPEPEQEPDLGPLPEYVIDPSRRLRPVADLDDTPAREPAPEPASPAGPAGLQFPSAGLAYLGIPPHTSDSEGLEPARESRPRPRAPEPPDRRTRERSTTEPGDDVEGDWVQDLSSKLSAYGLAPPSPEDEAAVEDDAEHEQDDSA